MSCKKATEEKYHELHARQDEVRVLKTELLDLAEETENSILVFGFSAQSFQGTPVNLLFGRKVFYINQAIVNVEILML